MRSESMILWEETADFLRSFRGAIITLLSTTTAATTMAVSILPAVAYEASEADPAGQAKTSLIDDEIIVSYRASLRDCECRLIESL